MFFSNEPKEYYSIDNFYFSSTIQKKKINEALQYNEPFVFIISKGGMGGSHLLNAAQKLNIEKNKTARFDACDIISNIKEENFSYQERLFAYDILFIDGFQIIADEAKEEFEEFAIKFVAKGGRIFLKANPSIGINSFIAFAKQFGYKKINLFSMSKKVKQLILKDNLKRSNPEQTAILSGNKAMIVWLKYPSYRLYENFIFFFLFNALENKTTINKGLEKNLSDTYFKCVKNVK